MASTSSTPARWQSTADAQRGGSSDAVAQHTSLRRRIAILLAIWIFALVPLLFVRTEWFGRPLSDQQIGEYLHAEQPNLVEHALSQIGDRMARRDTSVRIWYADLIRLAGHPNANVRALDAEVIGNDATQQAFHDTLSRMLDDKSRVVRFRAALGLARFGDPSGHDEIVSGLRPWIVTAPDGGRISDIPRLGSWVRESTTIAHLNGEAERFDIAAPVNGRISIVTCKSGDTVQSGTELIGIDPAADVIADVLSGLAAVGRTEDLPFVTALEAQAALPDRIRQQAAVAERSIRTRSGQPETTPAAAPAAVPALR